MNAFATLFVAAGIMCTSGLQDAPGAAAPLIPGLDHLPLGVRNLTDAAERYRQLGFTLKPGRPHKNGIQNQHVKFEDGTEIELITAAVARDALTAQYVGHLAKGDGPAFVGFYAPVMDSLARHLDAAGKPYQHENGLLTFGQSDELHYIFFGSRQHSPTDRPEHFKHANGAESLIGVWLAGDDLAFEQNLLAGLGATITNEEVYVPDAVQGSVAHFRLGEVVFLPGSRQRVPGRKIVGATVRVRDLKATQHVLAERGWKVQPAVKTGYGSSIFLPPDITHGIWLELREGHRFVQRERVARYSVRMEEGTVPRLHVSASVPIRGNLLTMERTRPGDIPELLKEGWPALVRDLHITDEAGRSVGTKARSTSGWELEQARNGWLNLVYDVDYTLPASLGWPAPRETAFKDSTHFVFVGRSLFITTAEIRSSIITFELPQPWTAVAPWTPVGGGRNAFSVDSAKDLTTNLILLTNTEPGSVTAGSFHVNFTPMGHWLPASADVRRVLQGVIPQFVKLMHHDDSAYYSIVLLPVPEYGGEAFRSSFAMTVDVQPSRSNLPVWGHTLAHEIFHYWNGFRLRGADYASSQWFQEGFTEYASDLAMLNSGLLSSDDFRERLARYIRNYEKLTTPLDAPGNSKGPPLYSAGALVAFCWDVQIRAATGGKHTVADFLGNLWRQTREGQRPYTWDDIRASLESTAHTDWESFYRDHINGSKKLPLADVFSRAGLVIVQSADSIAVKQDPEASTGERSVWQGIVQGR